MLLPLSTRCVFQPMAGFFRNHLCVLVVSICRRWSGLCCYSELCCLLLTHEVFQRTALWCAWLVILVTFTICQSNALYCCGWYYVLAFLSDICKMRGFILWMGIYLLSTKHTHRTKDRVTRTPLTTGGELRCPGRVSSSCRLTVT